MAELRGDENFALKAKHLVFSFLRTGYLLPTALSLVPVALATPKSGHPLPTGPDNSHSAGMAPASCDTQGVLRALSPRAGVSVAR